MSSATLDDYQSRYNFVYFGLKTVLFVFAALFVAALLYVGLFNDSPTVLGIHYQKWYFWLIGGLLMFIPLIFAAIEANSFNRFLFRDRLEHRLRMVTTTSRDSRAVQAFFGTFIVPFDSRNENGTIKRIGCYLAISLGLTLVVWPALHTNAEDEYSVIAYKTSYKRHPTGTLELVDSHTAYRLVRPGEYRWSGFDDVLPLHLGKISHQVEMDVHFENGIRRTVSLTLLMDVSRADLEVHGDVLDRLYLEDEGAYFFSRDSVEYHVYEVFEHLRLAELDLGSTELTSIVGQRLADELEEYLSETRVTYAGIADLQMGPVRYEHG